MEAYEYFLYILDKAVKKAGSPSRLAYSLNMAPNMITRWYKQERIPTDVYKRQTVDSRRPGSAQSWTRHVPGLQG